jgi:hypothetical protein
MLRRACSLLSVAALSVVAIPTLAAARLQPPSGQPQLSGSARLTGRVVATDNGRPVRRASVRRRLEVPCYRSRFSTRSTNRRLYQTSRSSLSGVRSRMHPRKSPCCSVTVHRCCCRPDSNVSTSVWPVVKGTEPACARRTFGARAYPIRAARTTNTTASHLRTFHASGG